MERLTYQEKDGNYNSKKTYYVLCNKLAGYENAEEQGLIKQLPCKVGDTVYVASSKLPVEDMEYYDDIDSPIPKYFPGRVVSFRFAKREYVKVAVKTKWLYEWMDEETGPEIDYIDSEKNFSFLLSEIGKTVFLTRAEAEKTMQRKEEIEKK